MLLEMLKSKLHAATVSECVLHKQGSVAIDLNLLEASNILPFERVDIWNITNGARIQTYAVEAPRGSCTIAVNGAASRHCSLGDRIIIASFARMEADQAKDHTPTILHLDEANILQAVG